MPFKIIETIENKRRLITTVPTLWEENGDLYWPKRNAFHLKKLEKSKPNKDEWTRLTCLVLRDNILNYKAAEQQVALMSDATDTDEKENERPRKNTKNTLNLNDLAMECMQSNEISEEASMVAAEDVSSAVVAKNSSTVVAAEDVSSANVGKTSSTVVAAETTSPVITMEDSSSFMLIGSNVLIPTEETNFLMPDLSQDITNNPTDSQNILLQPDDNLLLTDTSQHLDPELTESQTIITGSTEVPQQIGYVIEIMSAIQDNQKVLFDNQQNIIKGIALLNTKLEEFVMRSQEQSQEQHDKRLLKMITNIDELKAFEEQLNDPLIEAQYLKELSSSCSDKKTGDNNAYVLVDLIFDRKFMTHCSWGGGTKGEPKHCFKAYTKTFDFFFKAVHQHDKKFTKPNCEDFFKKVMRHSLKRSAAKRVRNSTTKNKKVKTSAAVNKRQETAV